LDEAAGKQAQSEIFRDIKLHSLCGSDLVRFGRSAFLLLFQ
jgi:hypothetical protein